MSDASSHQRCAECEATFSRRSPRHKFCSRRCKRLDESKRLFCSVAGCGRPRKGRGFCGTHYKRLMDHGSAMESVPIRPSTGRYVAPTGYAYLIKVGHPYVTRLNGVIAEHRFVMSEHLGRPLHDGETVHHKNGVREDNRLENLELRIGAHPRGASIEDRVADAVWVLREHAPHLLA